MTSAAMDKGFAMAAALGTVLYAVQKFFGTPVASYFGLRAAKEALAEFRRTGVNPYAPKEDVHGVQLLKKPSLKNTKNSMVLLLL